MTTTNLSTLAIALLESLKNSPLHEDKAVEILFNKPAFDKVDRKTYWQWESNAYGITYERPVGNGQSMEFTPESEKSYSEQTFEVYMELKKAGLARATNNGANSYTYRIVK